MTTATMIRPDRPSVVTLASPRSGQVLTGGPAARYHRGHPSVAEVRRPNYVARRLVAGAAAVLVLLGAVSVGGAIVASFGGTPAVAAEASPVSATGDAAVRSHVAAPGDTMWSIATAYRGDVDHDRYVDALIRLNGGTRIEVGQAVRLP